MKSFKVPDFRSGVLELRHDDGEVSIYGTPQGLTRLAELCLRLANRCDKSGSAHIHLAQVDQLEDEIVFSEVFVSEMGVPRRLQSSWLHGKPSIFGLEESRSRCS